MDQGQYQPLQQHQGHQEYQGHQGYPGFQGLKREWCHLKVVQQPKVGRSSIGDKDKLRKSIDPPPVVQLRISPDKDPERSYLQSPFLIVTCNLVHLPVNAANIGGQPAANSLVGTCVSTLHRLKDSKNQDGAFFIFADLSPKLEGNFALQFNLYEMGEHHAVYIKSIVSEKFIAHDPKNFVGLPESTQMTRSLADQGVRIRVRKEPRTLLRKRGPASGEYVRRSYKRVEQSVSEDQEEESQEPPLSSQAEHPGALQSPLEGPSSHHLAPFVGSSQQSAMSSDYRDEHDSKRSRTGSDQGHFNDFHGQRMAAAGQQRPKLPVTPPENLDGQHFKAQANPQQSIYSYSQHLPQKEMYDSYSQPPGVAQGGYGNPYSNVQQEITTPDYPPLNHFPSHAQQQYRPEFVGQGVHSPYAMDGGSRASEPTGPAIGQSSQYARMASNFGMGENLGEGRGSYNIPQFSNPDHVSAGMRPSPARGSSFPVTTGPGPLDNSCQ